MRFRFQAWNARSSQYRPDIDGLRAVAVLGVLFYHVGLKPFGGGFVGVDVFFVISGYLITSILIRDIEAGTFSFARFYERRIRRIFPALIAVALASLVVFSFLLTPKDLLAFAQGLVAMCGFASNMYFANLNHRLGYFGWAASEQALLHTWSLAVEEQFYFLFPLLLLLIQKFAQQYRRTIMLLLALLSFVYSAHSVASDATATYFSFAARGWELLMGALLAGEGIPTLPWRFIREIFGASGAALLVYASLVFTKQTPFPGPHALIPCFGAALILYAGRDGDSIVKSTLSFKPIVFIGVISFSLYLWHWPLLAFLRYFRTADWFPDTEIRVLILVSLLLAFLSFEFIESPFRAANSRFSRKWIFFLGIGSNIALAIAGLLLIHMHGLPQRFSPAIRLAVEQNEASADDWMHLGKCSNWRTPVHQFNDVSFCEVGHAQQNILFVGDSMIEQLYPLFPGYRTEDAFHGKGIVTAISAGCPPLMHLNQNDGGYYCDRLAQHIMERAKQDDIDTVFIQFSPWWSYIEGALCLTDERGCTKSLTRDEEIHISIDQLTAQIAQLQGAHKKVVLGLTYPQYSWPIPDLMAHNAIFGRYGHPPQQYSYRYYGDLEEKVAQRFKITTYDPWLALCPADKCIYQKNGVSLYRDQSHLAASQVGILHDSLLQAINAAR